MDLPGWATPDVMSHLRELKDFGFEFLFGIHNRVEKARLQGGKCTREGALCCCLAFASYQLFPFPRGPAGSHKEKSNQSSKCFCPSEPKTTCLFSGKLELGLAFSHLLLTGDWGLVIILTLSGFPTVQAVNSTCIFASDWVGDAVSGIVPLGSLRKIPNVSLFLLAQAHQWDWQTSGSHCAIHLLDGLMLLKYGVSEVWIHLSPLSSSLLPGKSSISSKLLSRN